MAVGSIASHSKKQSRLRKASWPTHPQRQSSAEECCSSDDDEEEEKRSKTTHHKQQEIQHIPTFEFVYSKQEASAVPGIDATKTQTLSDYAPASAVPGIVGSGMRAATY
ncbi:hypothetical protein SUGI_0632410 [Cryptomeria japonica]|nr:hypothetical protein SUGI_0632410 [Cryptomeria japonica]